MREVAEALGRRLVRRYTSGEFGAALVEDGVGRRAILKAMPDVPPWSEGWAASVHLAERLRLTGYPAPRYLAVGTVAGHRYTLQEELPGAVPRRLTGAHASRLLALAERHAGVATDRPPTWTGYVRAAVAGDHDAEGLALVRAAHPGAARLIARATALGPLVAGLALPEGDVVHGDFHHRNLLAEGERVTGVIDWEQATAGDLRYDVFLLAFWCAVDVGRVEPLAADLTRDRAAALLAPPERAAYAALVTLRVLGFFARFRPNLLSAAVGWCESLLAPAWR